MPSSSSVALAASSGGVLTSLMAPKLLAPQRRVPVKLSNHPQRQLGPASVCLSVRLSVCFLVDLLLPVRGRGVSKTAGLFGFFVNTTQGSNKQVKLHPDSVRSRFRLQALGSVPQLSLALTCS